MCFWIQIASSYPGDNREVYPGEYLIEIYLQISCCVPGTSLQVVEGFEPNAAAVLLEEEIREAVIGTTGAAVGAASDPENGSRVHF